MKLSSHKINRESRLDLEMTSMIDVVFLLLIFFMVTTSVVMAERQMRAAIKVDEKTASQSASDLEPAIVEVVRSGSRHVYRLGAREFTSSRSVRPPRSAMPSSTPRCVRWVSPFRRTTCGSRRV